MQGNHIKSKDDTLLPKIQSQKRIFTASDRRYNTEQQTALANRPLSNNGRTRSLRAFTSKTVKYETTGNLLNKKLQQVQKQTFLVDRQMKNVQDQINQIRQNIGNSRKQPGMSRLNESTTSFMSKISNKKLSLHETQTVNSQLKTLQTKIITSRNKIDAHLQRNKLIQSQIDAYRKQISTLKNINEQLQTSFKITSTKYNEQMQLSKRLDLQIAQKNQLTHKKKVQNLHQKAQMIKQYDVILKTLDKQLHTDKTQIQSDRSHFYLTDIVNQNPTQNSNILNKSGQKQRKQSAKRPKINEIKQKLKTYERQFQQLKQKVGSQNIEQITKKFTQEYQNNFHQYNFINQMYRQYQQANMEQFQLLQKKNQLLKELQVQKSHCKVRQIHDFRDKIRNINKRKQKIKTDMLLYNKVALQLKVYLGQYFNSLQISQAQRNQLIHQLNDKTVAQNIHKIYQTYSAQLNFISTQQSKQKRFIKNTSISQKQNVDDLIDEVRKQSQNSKDNRLLTRQQLQKNTIEMRDKRSQGSMMNSLQSRFKNKREIQKARNQKYGNGRKTAQ